MKRLLLWLSITTLLGCNDDIAIDKGCQFPPPTSNFKTFQYACSDCYFNMSINGQVYHFEGSQVNDESSCFGSDSLCMRIDTYSNAVFRFVIRSPTTAVELMNIYPPDTRFTSMQDIATPNSEPLDIALQVMNYCDEVFEAQYDIDFSEMKSSYGSITDIQIVDIHPGENSYITTYQLTGEFITYILINDEYRGVTGNYKIRMSGLELE